MRNNQPEKIGKFVGGLGCLAAILYLAWIAFVVWAIYAVVMWVTHQGNSTS